MKYNLIGSSVTETNLVEGNTDLTTNELLALTNYDGTPVTALSGGTVLCLDTDLGSRISLYELQYHFESTADKATTASGIEFFYKNESFEGYISLVTTYTGAGDLYSGTTLSGLFAPRYIRMKHTVGVSGTLYGYEILNNDEVVDFGTDGTLTSETISVSRNYGLDIKEIPIYNDGPGVVDAIVLVEPQNTDIDYLLSVSNDDEGPWYGPHTHELVLATEGTWDLGSYDGTKTYYDEEFLSIDGEIATGTKAHKFSIQDGVYETAIFQNDSSKLNHVQVFVDNADQDQRITTNLTTTADTIEVKSSSNIPTPYSIYLKLVEVGNQIDAYTYWQKTESVKSISTNKDSLGYSTDVLEKYKIYIDPVTGDYGGFYYIDSSATAYTYNSYVRLFNCINDGAFTRVNVVGYLTAINHTQYKSRMNAEQDQWFYFFSAVYDSGYEVDDTGYYLMCYDKDMNKLFKYFRTVNFLVDFDVVYDDRSVWIADNDGAQMKHFAHDGTVLGLYNSIGKTDNLTSVAVDNRDNSVWFSNGVDLHKINKYGTYETSIEDVGQTLINSGRLALDNNDEMWILENETLKRIQLTGDDPGRVLYEVYVANAVDITPTINGVWIEKSDEKTSYVSHNSRNITHTIDGNNLGYMEYNYDDPRYAEDAPLPIDSTWTTLDWQEVVLNDYTLSEDQYQQLRVTLQKSTPAQNYNVPVEEEWQVNDSFAQVSGTLVNDQRWSYVNRSEFTGSALRFLNYTGVDTSTNPRVQSRERFYIKGDCDIRFKFSITEGRVPEGSEEIIIYLYLRSLDYAESNYVGLRIQLRRAGIVSYLHNLWNGTRNYLSPTPLVDNELRFVKVGTTIYAYYKLANGSWSAATSYGNGGIATTVGERYYVRLEMDYTNFSDIDIYDFDVSSFTNNDNIYNYCLAPQVSRIFTQKAAQVYDIYPSTSKPVYVKTEIPTELDLVDNYDSDLSVRWRIPVE